MKFRNEGNELFLYTDFPLEEEEIFVILLYKHDSDLCNCCIFT